MIFRQIEVEDGRWARPLLEAKGYQSCEFNFVDVYMWSAVNKSRISRFEDFVMVRSQDKERLYYLFPSGKGDLKRAIDAIFEDALEAGKPPVIFSVPTEELDHMQAMYPGMFDFVSPQSQQDYVYASEDLAWLKGRKYQKKRNHCARFERDYPDWAFHEIDADSLEQVCAFNNRWCNLYDNRDDVGIQNEHEAIELVCRHYEELRLKGGYITVQGEVVAFSFGSPLGADMFVTHVEKALYDVSGAYNIINREMARRFCTGYTNINRENDEGEEGLREAKRSYQPLYMVDKHRALVRHWPPKSL